jgi:signal peptidase I
LHDDPGSVKQKPGQAGGWRSTLLTVLLAVLFSYFGFTSVGISGDSMLPALHSGERALVPRWETWLHRAGQGEFRQGDIVFFARPGSSAVLCPFRCEYLIKRIVATGGETVALVDGRLYVNSELQSEPYLGGSWRGSASLPPLVVPEGTVFVLGDNRAPYGSFDSRSFGPVPVSSLVGRTSAVIWPLLRRDAAGGWHWNPRSLDPAAAG